MPDDSPNAALSAPQAPEPQEVIVPVDGRVPPPSLLERYERVLPGSADRLFKLAEAEQAHRQALESQDLAHRHTIEARKTDTASRVQKRSQSFGFTLAVMGVSFGAVLGGMWLILRLFWGRRTPR